jgi:thioredoxin domain-containing protein 5
VEKYQGQRTDEDLKAFVKQKLGSSDSLSAEGTTVPETSSPVISYSGDNFEHGIANGISFTKFFAPW